MKHDKFIRESLDQNLSGLHVSRQQQIDMIDEIVGGAKMKRKMPLSVALVAILILTSVTAFAIVNFYSVRDYVANGNPSAAFEEAIVPVEKSVESCGLTMAFGDAVCDGQNLMFAMDITAAEGTEPVYVYPSLSATCDGVPLEVYYGGFDFAYGAGAIIPSLNPNEPLVASNRGFEVELDEPVQSGKIDWTYTLRLYKPTGKLVNVGYEWPEDGREPRNWSEYYRSLYENGEIGVFAGNSIGDYLLALRPDGEEHGDLTEAERAERSGLFELADTVVFEFTTEVSDGSNLVGETVYAFDGYTVTVKSITTSFMQVNYELEAVYDEPQPSEHDLIQSYVLTDQEGNVMPWRSSTWSLAEDGRTCKVWGSVERITDAPLTEITFTLSNDPTGNHSAEDMPSFTIKINE